MSSRAEHALRSAGAHVILGEWSINIWSLRDEALPDLFYRETISLDLRTPQFGS
jgi:hypothetical protein